MSLVKIIFQNLFEVVLERFMDHIMRLMAAIFDGPHRGPLVIHQKI